jgi:hypothetical protein
MDWLHFFGVHSSNTKLLNFHPSTTFLSPRFELSPNFSTLLNWEIELYQQRIKKLTWEILPVHA